MKFSSSLLWYCLLFCLAARPAPVSAADIRPSASKAKLDTALVHKIYLEGDFDHAIDLLESAMRYGQPFSHGDSVFTFKHLGVMYAAKYETREKGKTYMMKLLQVEPTARIMDMYASDMIYMIFKNIQDEFELSQARLREEDRRRDSARVHSDTSQFKTKDRIKSAKPKKYAWLGWTAGALAAAGGIAIAIHMAEENPSGMDRVVE